jgi:hypothetical protein
MNDKLQFISYKIAMTSSLLLSESYYHSGVDPFLVAVEQGPAQLGRQLTSIDALV